MKKLTVQIAIHLAAWLCFLLLPLLFFSRPREIDLTFFKDRYLSTYFIINNGFFIAFYYLNTYLFLPKLLDQKKFISYTILILALLVFCTFLPRIYHSLSGGNSPNVQVVANSGAGATPGSVNPGATKVNPSPGSVDPGATNVNPSPGNVNPSPGSVDPGATKVNPSPGSVNPGATKVNPNPGSNGSIRPEGNRFAPGPHPGGPNRVRPLVNPFNLAIFLLVFVFSTGIRVINQWLLSEARAKEIANEKLKAELSFLKAQINPHFLFNTLNNIYALASAQSEHTAEAVMKLSSIMRYVLTEARNDLVPLEKEIQFTSHYIELQKMRLTDKTIIEFSVRGEPLGRQIAPLLLLPFVENAFKYGISTREYSPIKILLEIKDNSLYFSICNHKQLNTMLRASDNTGIGISNTKRRLDLFYEDRYSLDIQDKTSGANEKVNGANGKINGANEKINGVNEKVNEFIVHLKVPV